MKGWHLIAFVALALIALFWIFSDKSHTITNLPQSGTTIVAFGDSLVAGAGTSPGNDFASILSDRLGEEVINLGVAGDTTTDGLARIDDVLAKDPRIVILLLGGNDALRRAPVETIFANLGTIIQTIQKSGAGVVLVGVTGGIYYSQSFEKSFEALARKYGVAFVPNILDGLIGKSEYMADRIHPNDAGHRLMADRIEAQLRLLL